MHMDPNMQENKQNVFDKTNPKKKKSFKKWKRNSYEMWTCNFVYTPYEVCLMPIS